MASRAPSQFILHVRFESLPCGGLRATCDKVPNFYLSHSNPAMLRADVEPALETILSDMYGMPMTVKRLPELDEAVEQQLSFPPEITGQGSYLGTACSH